MNNQETKIKACRYCAHFLSRGNLQPLCARTNKPMLSALSKGTSFNFCSFERKEGDCGQEGKYFKEMEKEG